MILLLCVLARAAPIVDPFTEPDDSELYRQEERIVTVAARYAQTIRDAPAIVTVVTDREIRERGYRTLADVLRATPGVYVTTSNESRKIVWFRGVTSPDNNKVLLLVDGVPWYDGVYTHAWVDEYLPLDNVRQIEIIKGPGSAIYGTNAFAGVINVVTYTPAELDGGFARAIGGSSFRHGLSLVVGKPFAVGTHKGGFNAYARYFDTDGDGLDWTPRGRRNVSGSDPKRAMNAGFRVNYDGLDVRFDAIEYRTTYFVNEQDDALDVFTQSADDFWLKNHDQLVTASWTTRPLDGITVIPRLHWRRYDNPGQYAYFNDPVTTVDDEGALSTAWSTTLVETFKLTEYFDAGVDVEAHPTASHIVVGGVGGELTHVVRIEDVSYVDRAHAAGDGVRFGAKPTWLGEGFVYAQDTWTALPFLELTGGARLDLHTTYGAFASPRAGVLLIPSDAAVLKVLFGRAFRSPTTREWLVEAESDENGVNPFTAGNPELRPESINTAETEFSLTLPTASSVRVAAFYSAVRDEINKVKVEIPDPELGDDYYANSGGTDILGGEVEGTTTRGPFTLAGAYSYTHAIDRDTGFRVYEFPQHMAHARAGWRLPDVLRATVSVDGYGPRPREEWSPTAGAQDGKPFALLGASVATDSLLKGKVRADLTVTNVLDTKYQTLIYRDDADEPGDGTRKYPRDLSGEGRAFQVGIEVGF